MVQAVQELREAQAVISPGDPLVVLLDVDGVVNYWGGKPTAKTPDVVKHGGLWIPRGMDLLIKDLSAAVDEIWWCTAWRDQANNLVSALIGLPHLRVITDSYPHGHGADWKAIEVRKLLQRDDFDGWDRKYIWIEDVIQSWTTPGLVWDLQKQFPGRIRVVDTSDAGCLTREHLEGWLL